jgi:hypothetical protein
VAELRRLEALATPAPWDVHRYDCDDADINYQLQRCGGAGEVVTNVFESTNQNNRADARYIAALRNAAPALLAELDRLREAVEGQRKALRGLVNHSAGCVTEPPCGDCGYCRAVAALPTPPLEQEPSNG